jgi:membrane protein YdbS with pleckstrin-like domain
MRLVPNTDTVPASVNRYLLPHERQVITVHTHPAVLVGPVGLAVAGLIAAAVETTSSGLSSDARLIIWLAWGLWFLYTITKVISWSESYFVATRQRMMIVKGIFTRDVISIPLTTVGSFRFRRTTMGRVLGYGQFIIETERVHPVWTASFLPYPEQLYLELIGMIYRAADENLDSDSGMIPEWSQPGTYPAGQLDGPTGQPESRGSRRTEQPVDEVYPEHGGRDEDEKRGP